MNLSWKRTSAWLAAGALSLLSALAYGAAKEVWDAKADHAKRLDVLETQNANDHEMLREVRQDVKEILRRLPQ